jgi:putative aldouronate transport system permease protein
MAIAFVAILPIMLIFPLFQKYYAKGISVGAVK